MEEFKITPRFVLFVLVSLVFIAILVQTSWNYVIAHIFELKSLTFRESIALILVLPLLKKLLLPIQSKSELKLNRQLMVKMISRFTFLCFLVLVAYGLVGGFGF